MPTKKAIVTRVSKTPQAPGATGAKSNRHYGVAYTWLGQNTVHVRRVAPKKMKAVAR